MTTVKKLLATSHKMTYWTRMVGTEEFQREGNKQRKQSQNNLGLSKQEEVKKQKTKSSHKVLSLWYWPTMVQVWI